MDIDVFLDTTMNVGTIIYSHFSEDHDRKFLIRLGRLRLSQFSLQTGRIPLVMMGSRGYLRKEVQNQDGKWIEVEHRLTDPRWGS